MQSCGTALYCCIVKTVTKGLQLCGSTQLMLYTLWYYFTYHLTIKHFYTEREVESEYICSYKTEKCHIYWETFLFEIQLKISLKLTIWIGFHY